MKPEFVDNREGNTLVAALQGHLDWLGDTYAQPVELSIATGYFNPAGAGHMNVYFRCALAYYTLRAKSKIRSGGSIANHNSEVLRAIL